MRDLWESSFLHEDYRQIQQIIGDTITSSNPVIREPLHNLVSQKGKLLRPMLVVLASRFGSPDKSGAKQKIHNIAAAIEILHLATLVHDDVIDDSPVRRGAPTLHTQIGKKQAILIGDYLFSQCFSLVAEHANLENSKLLARVVSSICSSEISQTEDSFSFKTSVRRYNRRIAGKTAALFAISCFVGASESGSKKPVCALFSRIGYNLGMGFQIKDDILDYTGDRNKLGKPVGSDLREGIATLPLIYALQSDSGRLRQLLKAPPAADKDIWNVISLVAANGGVEKAEEQAALYTERAYQAIAKLPDTTSTKLLNTTLDRLLFRLY
jgi:heptaprenyl diphosphate synthase